MMRRLLLIVLLLMVLAAGVIWWGLFRLRGDGTEAASPADVPVAPGFAVAAPALPPAPIAVPDLTARPDLPAGPPPPTVAPPPAPRHLPFKVGETALYQVEWLGFGAGVSAGTAEFSVTAPSAPGGAYGFELMAVTAPWVSTFFEARDWFGSVTTADLFPVEHRQDLREGRRHVVQTALFDRAARVVRVGRGALTSPADGVTRPLPTGARDPLGAMYFVRTIDWRPGQAMRLEVSDLGHPVGVDIRADLTESVKAEGRTQLARRITVRFDARSASIPVPAATVWLSADARRIPLAAQMDSSYGVFRLSLVRHKEPL